MNFEDLLTKITPKLRAIARRLDGKYTSFNDDDLFQEAALNLWQKYREGRTGEDTDSFILQGCYFFLKNYIRKNYKRIDRQSLSLEKIFEDGNISLQNRLPALGRKEVTAIFSGRFLMEDFAKVLTGKERKILTFKVEGRSTREIGRFLGMSHVMVVKLMKGIRNKCAAVYYRLPEKAD